MKTRLTLLAAGVLAAIFVLAPISSARVALACGSSIDAAYHAAAPGSTITLAAGCAYPGTTLTYDASKVGATSRVVIQRQAGTTIAGFSIRGAQHFELHDVTVPGDIFGTAQNGSSSPGGARFSDARFVNVTTSIFFVRSALNVSFIGGQMGPRHNGDNPTVGTYQGQPASENVTFDSTRFFDIDRSANPSTHTQCLFLQESINTVVKNSTFSQCEVFDVYVNNILGGGYPPPTATFLNNHFGVTTPTGFYALRANIGTFTVSNNVFDQGIAFDAPVQYSGCGNSGSGTMPASLRTACSGGGDTTKPSDPGVPTQTSSTTASASFSWAASTDNVAVTGYNVYSGTAKVATQTGLSYTLSGLSCGVSYPVSVEAFDAAGNISGRTAGTVTASACQVAVSAPTNLHVTAKTKRTVTLAWDYTGAPVTGFRFYVNGAKVSTGTDPAQRSTRFGLRRGQTATLGVEAYDATTSAVTSLPVTN